MFTDAVVGTTAQWYRVYECRDFANDPPGRAVVCINTMTRGDSAGFFFEGVHMAASAVYYSYWPGLSCGREDCTYHLCQGNPERSMSLFREARSHKRGRTVICVGAWRRVCLKTILDFILRPAARRETDGGTAGTSLAPQLTLIRGVCSATSSEEQERGRKNSAPIQLKQAGGSRPCGSGREGRAAVDGASDQKKSSCGQEGGGERQGQAERQRQYQVELGQFQDMLADTSPEGCNAAEFAAALVIAVVQEPSHLGLLCCYLLSRPSLHLQSGRQHNLLPLPMPFDPVLSVRTACPAAWFDCGF